MVMNDFYSLKNYDRSNMFGILKDFSGQITEAWQIGKNAPLFKETMTPRNILILGMGGSAIGGDLLRSYSLATPGADHLRIHINRTYDIPGFVDDSFHVIASSYSGGTEETLHSFGQAAKKSKYLLSICSGGKLAEFSNLNNIPVIEIPGGMQPRCALGYSFIVLLNLMMRTGAFSEEATGKTNQAISESIDLINERSEEYSRFEDNNPAIVLANRIKGKIPVIYSASERFDTVNLRWRGQIQENAKHIAFGNLLPEMNHNEINGWQLPEDMQKSFIFLFLEDKEENPRIALRFKALKNILQKQGKEVITLTAKGNTLLTRMLDSIFLADWTSYYLSLLYKQDPTAIPVITELKNFLSQNEE